MRTVILFITMEDGRRTTEKLQITAQPSSVRGQSSIFLHPSARLVKELVLCQGETAASRVPRLGQVKTFHLLNLSLQHGSELTQYHCGRAPDLVPLNVKKRDVNPFTPDLPCLLPDRIFVQ